MDNSKRPYIGFYNHQESQRNFKPRLPTGTQNKVGNIRELSILQANKRKKTKKTFSRSENAQILKENWEKEKEEAKRNREHVDIDIPYEEPWFLRDEYVSFLLLIFNRFKMKTNARKVIQTTILQLCTSRKTNGLNSLLLCTSIGRLNQSISKKFCCSSLESSTNCTMKMQLSLTGSWIWTGSEHQRDFMLDFQKKLYPKILQN